MKILAGIGLGVPILGLAIAMGSYFNYNKKPSTPKPIVDDAGIISKNVRDVSIGIGQSCEELLGRLATIKEIAACKKGFQAGLDNATKAVIR